MLSGGLEAALLSTRTHGLHLTLPPHKAVSAPIQPSIRSTYTHTRGLVRLREPSFAPARQCFGSMNALDGWWPPLPTASFSPFIIAVHMLGC